MTRDLYWPGEGVVPLVKSRSVDVPGEDLKVDRPVPLFKAVVRKQLIATKTFTHAGSHHLSMPSGCGRQTTSSTIDLVSTISCLAIPISVSSLDAQWIPTSLTPIPMSGHILYLSA